MRSTCQIQREVLGSNQERGKRKRRKGRHREKSVTLPPSKVESRPNFLFEMMKGVGGSYDCWSSGAPGDVDVVSVVRRGGEGDCETMGYSRVGGSSGGV